MGGCCRFGFFPGWGIVMVLFWALIIGGVALLVVWLIQQAGPATAGPPPSEGRALEILQERYARGEITREEYERMRQDLVGR